MILVGSRAAAYHLPQLEERSKRADRDIWVEEGCQAEPLSDPTIMPRRVLELIPTTRVPSLDALYTIKVAHLPHPNQHWLKHAQDALLFQREGAVLLPELHRELVKFWASKFARKPVSLRQSKADFFTDAVTYVFDHDALHEMVAHPNRPVYESCLADGESVLVDRARFFAMPFARQVQMFKEEIAVIATERWLVNPANRGKFSLRKAWQLSLEKTVTSLTKGWASDFLAQNLAEFYSTDLGLLTKLLIATDESENIMGQKEDLEKIEQLAEGLHWEYGRPNLDELVFSLAEPLESWRGKALLENLGDRHEYVIQEGGGEGGAEDCFGVFRIDGDYYRVDYGYRSHEGYSSDGAAESLRRVKPVERTITVYE